MAQGRMIKKRISQSRKFAALKTHNARLLYLMILPHVDVAGRIEATPDLLRSTVCPLLAFSDKEITEYLKDLAQVGLIILYQNGGEGELYLQITRFEDFQSLRADKEAASSFPDPKSCTLLHNSRTTTGQVPGKDKISKDKLSQDKESKEKQEFNKPIACGNQEERKKTLRQQAKKLGVKK